MKVAHARWFLALSILGAAFAACTPEATQAPPLPAPAVSTTVPQSVAVATAAPTGAAVESQAPMPVATTVAATEPPAPVPAPALLSGAFVKEEVSVTGSYTLDPASSTLVFSDDFRVSQGPDLFVVLSGASDLTVDYLTFSSMVTGSTILTLGPLANISGAQTYFVPTGTDLSSFRTVVVWCQAFSVAFAAAPLAAP